MSEIVLLKSEQQCSAAGYLSFKGNLLNTDEAENDATVCIYVCPHEVETVC